MPFVDTDIVNFRTGKRTAAGIAAAVRSLVA
jgi:hypothetical protein